MDINPPTGAVSRVEFLDFPIDYAIKAHDLPSLFAGKCHALLCRDYAKGRDWFDLAWYTAQKVEPNYEFLQAALHQFGPWQNVPLEVNSAWLKERLVERIDEINWTDAVNDVSRFLKTEQRKSLELWSPEFFKSKLKRLG